MRLLIIRAFLTLGYCMALLVALGFILAIYGPIHPGSIAFPVQDFAEQKFGTLYTDPITKDSYLLRLASRRISDLKLRTGSANEYVSVVCLSKAIDQAGEAISALPQNKRESLQNQFFLIAKESEDVLKQLTRVPIENSKAFSALLVKIQTIQKMAGAINSQNSGPYQLPGSAVSPPQAAQTMINTIHTASGLIPWPIGSLGAEHAFYPLLGQHAGIQCISCHNQGVYFGVPNQCITCHIMKIPNPHFPGDCGLCHTPISWTDIHFDHTVVSTTACETCHEKDKPANHYNGPCGACHITQNWTTVTFNHDVAGAVDCISCHTKDAPANHYKGQCSNCHSTSDAWKNAHFNHSGFTDCISCHANKAPANHYKGQCSNCHNTSNWTSVVFNHAGFTDCISCHANKAPANHYAGQCSNCHNTSNWASVVFDHSGFTDCQACHSGKAPANHYPYQCSLCHTTSTWLGGYFSHNSGYPDCISCHLKDRPAEHDSGQCSKCHNTNSWGGAGGGLAINSVPASIDVNCVVCHKGSKINLITFANHSYATKISAEF